MVDRRREGGGRRGLSERSGRVEYNQESIIIGYTPCTIYLWIWTIAGRGEEGRGGTR